MILNAKIRKEKYMKLRKMTRILWGGGHLTQS